MCTWIVMGFLVGLLARALMPGTQRMGFIATTLLGIAGSGVGGVLAALLRGGDIHIYKPTGLLTFVGAVIGAMVLLFIGAAVSKRR